MNCRKTVVTIVAVFVIVAILIGVGFYIYGLDLSLNRFFSGWQAETSSTLAAVCHNASVEYAGGSFSFTKDYGSDKLSSGNLCDVFCIKDERIFFCFSNYDKESNQKAYCLASIKTDGSQLKEHITVTMASNLSYQRMSQWGQAEDIYGGLYQNGIIYMKTDRECVAFDIDKEEAYPIDSMPQTDYTGTVTDTGSYLTNAFTVTERFTSQVKTITLEAISEANPYANKIWELSKQKRWDGYSCAENFFNCVQIIDQKIYFIAQIHNWHGEGTVVVFEYDFHKETVSYVTHKRGIQHPETQYYIIPVSP